MRIPTNKYYYVYTHSVEGNVFYVGKGCEGRAFAKNGRAKLWQDFVISLDHYDVDIIKGFDDSAEALLFEENLIAEIKPKCNKTHEVIQRKAVVSEGSTQEGLVEPSWDKIIARIQKKGLTQKAIEKATGVEQQTISKMKRGLYKRASWVIGNAVLKLDEKLRGKK